jgi:hypothetical protein
MSFLGRVGKLARSPKGKKLIDDTQELAKDPQTKKKIEEARQRLVKKDTSPAP